MDEQFKSLPAFIGADSGSSLEYFRTIQNDLSERIAFFRRKRAWNSKAATMFVAASSFLPALATVAIGAAEALDRKWITVIALVASGLATVSGSLEALFSHRRLWSINIAAIAALEKLKRDMRYRSLQPMPLEADELHSFRAAYDRILDDVDAAWVGVYARSSSSAPSRLPPVTTAVGNGPPAVPGR